MKCMIFFCLVFANVTFALHGVSVINATNATEITVGGTNYYTDGRGMMVERLPLSIMQPNNSLDVRLREMTVIVNGQSYHFIGLSQDTVITVFQEDDGEIVISRLLRADLERNEN